MEKSITNLVHGGIKQWAPKLLIKKALVDFSSPESSGAMDFLHFRAAIIGDSIARILEFSGVKVMRASHVTAYGSQGWQLIRSSEWKPMPVDTCQQLREFYTLAGIQWQDEEGTFYSVREEALKNLRNDMKEKFLVMPRGDILTELISLEYRLKYQKADWIIYISHATHEDHFFQTFKVAESAGWHGGDNDYPKFSHISLQKKCDFGLAMQFNDVFKGVKSRSENLLKFVLPESEYQRVKTSHSVAYASLKYAILKKTFGEIAFDEIDVKHLFNRKGKTAVYLLRTYSWISGMLDHVHREELKKNNAVVVEHVGARALALYLLRFPEVIQKALDSLSAAVLCDYVYDLAMIFTQKFYAEYARDLQFARVHFDHQEQRLKELTAAAMSRRTLLIEATRIVMEKCLELLGLEPVSCLLF
uniref:arginine--tRNA ligase, cytoplasmic-like n=1 Tax=Fragaria vesca subsp. vesca TaxID=101020 RepID=UPI0005C88B48|nr:PREDICTED: arginine--tRNA ligase, cytoplasmic-like [Fragaria vesca subsp. vesca]